MIRLIIADDHPPTRAGVRGALEPHGFDVVGEASDAEGAVALAFEHEPDVALLDVHMPGNGIHAARLITNDLPHTAVVMLTVSRNDEDLFDALRAGAVGYLLKETDPDRLPNAIRGVVAGEAALPRALVAKVIEEFRGRPRRLPLLRERGTPLTSREWEVLELMKQGLSTAQMAERMFVSKVTVRTHVASILRKLKVSDRAAAIELLRDGGGDGDAGKAASGP